jgi:tetratricopeptide (TPR) repeat protein
MLRRQLSGLLRGERRRRLLDALIADVVLTWLAARRMAETACEIDADPREAHWAMSYVAMHEGRFGEAVARLRQALAVDASCADAYALLALIHIFTKARRHFAGDTAQALINLREARARNPTAPGWTGSRCETTRNGKDWRRRSANWGSERGGYGAQSAQRRAE